MTKRYCECCGTLMIEKQYFYKYSWASGKKLYSIYLQCPKYSWWNTDHDIINIHESVEI